MFFLSSFAFLPEIFFGFAILLFFLMCIFMRVNYRIDNRIPLLSVFSLSFSLIALIGVCLLFSVAPTCMGFSVETSFAINLLKALLTIITFIMLLVVYPSMKYVSSEYYLLILISLFASFFVISSNDFIILYLGIELSSFCFFILIGSNRNSLLACEASFKYFVFSTLSSVFLLLGGSVFYGIAGTLNFSDLRRLYYTRYCFKVSCYNYWYLFCGYLFFI